MQPAVLIRLRPLGPWRFGAGEGSGHRLDTIYRSDRLYSAVTLALQQLGLLEEWLDSTARAETPAVTFSSLFPFQGDTLFAPPPAHLWPPPPALLTSPSPAFLAKMRWEAVRFVPLNLVEALVTGQPVLADQWVIDAESGCLLRRDRPSQSPFRFASRPRAAVDRLTSASHRTSPSDCLEFEAGSGLWLTICFATTAAETAWADRLRAAFRLLADTGFGGRRTSGWGQTSEPEWQSGSLPALLLPKLRRKGHSEEGLSPFYWLLSLYSPASSDTVDWKTGDYRVVLRGGRVQSHAGSGELKKNVRMVSEGSVLSAQQQPIGAAVDVAPDGFAHPVYRAGFALTVQLPDIHQLSTELEIVEETPVPPDPQEDGPRPDDPQPETATTMQSDLADEEQPTSEPEPPAPEESERPSDEL